MREICLKLYSSKKTLGAVRRNRGVSELPRRDSNAHPKVTVCEDMGDGEAFEDAGHGVDEKFLLSSFSIGWRSTQGCGAPLPTSPPQMMVMIVEKNFERESSEMTQSVTFWGL